MVKHARVLIACLLWVGVSVAAERTAKAAWRSIAAYRSPYRLSDNLEAGEPLVRDAILVVVDGLRLDRSRLLPNLNRLRHRGADLECVSGIPSYSRPGRANLATGASPEIHGATTNLHEGEVGFDNLFRGVARQHGSLAIAGSNLWVSLFRTDLKDAAFLGPEIADTRGAFQRVAPLMMRNDVRAVEFLLERKARLGVLDFLALDYAAHEYGARSPEYARVAGEADRLIGVLLDRVDLFRTLLVVTADHGHLLEGGHGGREAEVTAIPLVIAGRGVREAVAGTARQVDVAPTLATLLGLPIPGASEGRVLREVLELPPDLAAGAAAREKTHAATFAREFAASLGVEAAGVDAARAARLLADRTQRRPWDMGLALLGLGLFAWFAWPRLSERLAGAAAGFLLNEAFFHLLVAREGLRLSLSAINHEEDLRPYFSHVGWLAAGACGMSVAAVFLAAWLLKRPPLPLAASAVFGIGLGLGLAVLRVHGDQGLLAVWTIGDIDLAFSAYVGLLRLRALGFCALVLPVLLLNSRFSREA